MWVALDGVRDSLYIDINFRMVSDIMTRLFIEFFKTEKASGLILIACTIVSLSLANSGVATSYLSLWQLPFFGQTLSYWINDGLMTVFFLLIGLEIEREIYVGELSQPRKALLPIVAAIGGMAVPALFHFSVNAGTSTQAGIGIPMATDIAFALAVLSLLGNRIPLSLKVFLTALAIIDDLGAILVIAIFYSGNLSVANLLIAGVIIVVLFVCNRLKISSLVLYLVGGIFLWHFVHQSGIHATITGVILAFLIPFGKGDESSPSYRLQHRLHIPVAFFILPLFALANTSLTIAPGWYLSLLHPNSIGIALGLVLGKPIGITMFSVLGVRMKILALPGDLKWKHIASVSVLGGIGFTMSIFIALLAFQDAAVVQESKIAILISSLFAGLLGYGILRVATQRSSVVLSTGPGLE
jgi:Na+:H+ antiporter, NhaA family